MGFWESVAGKMFTEGTVPRIGKQLERIANALEEYNKPDVMTADQLANSGTREDALEAALHLLLKDLFEAESAGHVRYEHLTMAVEISNFNDIYPNCQPTGVWDDDRTQFARLLCEIVATQAKMIDNPNALEESMDLPMERINELFDRANNVWEASKKAFCPAPNDPSLEDQAIEAACTEECAKHHPECDGFCDHIDHKNMCLEIADADKSSSSE